MNTTRRNFIRAGAISAITLFSLGSTENLFGQMILNDGKIIPSESLSDPVLTFVSDHFKPFINTNFKFQHDEMDGYENFRLIDVKDLKNKVNQLNGFKGESFSLLFKSNGKTKIAGRTFNISHNGLGEFSLFVEPVTSKENLYEAIINRVNF